MRGIAGHSPCQPFQFWLHGLMFARLRRSLRKSDGLRQISRVLSGKPSGEDLTAHSEGGDDGKEAILFITSTYPGDAVVSSGLLQHLIDASPLARLTVVCGRPSAPLFTEVPNLEDLIVVNKRKHHLHWAEIWLRCVTTRWSLVVDLRGSLLAYTLWARKRRVFRPKMPQGGRRISEWSALIGLSELPSPTLWLAPRHEEAVDRLLRDGPPVLALGPTANWPAKIWPAERFAELALRLTDKNGILPGARIALIGTRGDEEKVRPIVAAIPENRMVNLIGRTDLLTLVAVLKRCALYIGNDSGPLYLSVAAGIPGLGLMGPSPGLFGPQQGPYVAPWAKRTDLVRTAKTPEELTGTPDYDTKTVGSLMDSLTVDAAEAAANALWRRLSRAAAPQAT